MSLRLYYRYVAWRLFDFGLRRFGRIDGPEINATLWLALTATFNLLTIDKVVEALTGRAARPLLGEIGVMGIGVVIFVVHYLLLVRSGAIEELDSDTVEWAKSSPGAASAVFWGYLLGSMAVFFGVVVAL